MREKACLESTAMGHRTTEIANQMSIHEKTVEKHLASARKKLGAATTTQAVATAIHRGILELK